MAGKGSRRLTGRRGRTTPRVASLVRRAVRRLPGGGRVAGRGVVPPTPSAGPAGPDDGGGSAGVREPRRPRPTLPALAATAAPPDPEPVPDRGGSVQPQ